LRLSVLRSGSSGNATLVRAGGHCVLIDAGIGPRVLSAELHCHGVTSLDAIFITHEHHDHVKGLELILRYHETLVMANEPTLRCLTVSSHDRQALPIGSEVRFGPLLVRSFPVPHDAACPAGYWLEDDESRVCIATDLGQTPGEMLEYMRAADLVMLESNYDPQMLDQGPYPPMLKQRIRGSHGHLSNQQAAEAIVATADGGAMDIWLAHLSATNNHPDVAHSSVVGRLERAGLGHLRVQVALRNRTSLEWDGPGGHRQGRLGL
jgi:phosphoribosyl 1,2-cyclic phosphodiesterase